MPEIEDSNLIVNYLPLSYRERHLSKLFSKIAEIKSCRVMRFVQEGRTLSKGYGFVKYFSVNDARKAIELLNGKNVLGKRIKVSLARPNAQRSKSNLFISQIPKWWKNEDLYKQFSYFGNIIESRILHNDTGESRRCGFVRYDSDEMASKALAGMSDFRASPHDVPLRVRVATQHEKNKIRVKKTKQEVAMAHVPMPQVSTNVSRTSREEVNMYPYTDSEIINDFLLLDRYYDDYEPLLFNHHRYRYPIRYPIFNSERSIFQEEMYRNRRSLSPKSSHSYGISSRSSGSSEEFLHYDREVLSRRYDTCTSPYYNFVY